jgi:hypothetical protein
MLAAIARMPVTHFESALGGEGSGEQPGDVPEVEALVTEIHGLLQLLWSERPPLAAANTPSIRQ